jgi:hypothetical protein
LLYFQPLDRFIGIEHNPHYEPLAPLTAPEGQVKWMRSFCRVCLIAITSLIVTPLTVLAQDGTTSGDKPADKPMPSGLVSPPPPITGTLVWPAEMRRATTPLEHNNKGVELGVKGIWPLAIDEAKLAAAGDPNNQAFRRNLSGAHLRFGDKLATDRHCTAAIKEYREAIFVDSKNGAAENGLNACLRHLGKNPDDVGTRVLEAEQAEKNCSWREAAVEYYIGTQIDPSALNFYNLGRCTIEAGSKQPGYNSLKTALTKPWQKNEEAARAACQHLGDEIDGKSANK